MTIPISPLTISITLLLLSIFGLVLACRADCKSSTIYSNSIWPCPRCLAIMIMIVLLVGSLIWTITNVRTKYDNIQTNKLKQTLGPKWYEIYKALENTKLCASRCIAIQQTKNHNMPPLSIEAFELLGNLLNHEHRIGEPDHNEEWTILKSYIKILPE